VKEEKVNQGEGIKKVNLSFPSGTEVNQVQDAKKSILTYPKWLTSKSRRQWKNKLYWSILRKTKVRSYSSSKNCPNVWPFLIALLITQQSLVMASHENYMSYYLMSALI
jgi:hypothetical protein